ncbi:histidine--tRNA ligase, cytoplasmic-like [Anopheles darlingi]|uniref:histidine--tRNA ligase, cytoplasmic-like n=1 Tax=Anopheles darlingi TaxID=43151 RepID=UPI0021005A34|nr:histidine--tRNA ligase, cytoplasmic-like [Anopheles darlingi]
MADSNSDSKVAFRMFRRLVSGKAAQRQWCVALGHRESKVSNAVSPMLKTAKGTRDYDPVAMALRQRALKQVIDVFERHGAVTIDTPVFERKELLRGMYGDDAKLIYDLQDQGGELLALRYDLTVPFARYLAMSNIGHIKRYQIGKVYRRDNPQIGRGRYREFLQCDFDIAGTYEPMLPDAECLKVLVDILDKLAVGDFTVMLNHRKLLDGIFGASGVPVDKFRTIGSSVDKLDKLPWEGVRDEMIEQKGLDEKTVDRIRTYVTLTGGVELIEQLEEDSQLKHFEDAIEGLRDMRLLLKYCELLGVQDRITFNLSLARGLDYYTGVIFEAVLRATDENSVGSLAGGGRYDNLVGTFHRKDQQIPCVGVSIGFERIFSLLESKASRSGDQQKVRIAETQVYVASAHKGLLLKRLEILNQLWAAGIKAEHSYKRDPKLLAQLRYCEEQCIPYALILGDAELARGILKLRSVSDRQEEELKLDTFVNEVLDRLRKAGHD